MISARLFPTIILILSVAWFSPAGSQPDSITVIIDAGHGGADLGARSSRSVLEKSITLKIARIIESKLSIFDNLKVVLTRSDDKEIGLIKRIETANSAKGDLLISIHAGGGNNKRTLARKIYINDSDASEQGVNGSNAWSELNSKYGIKNLQLASSISDKLMAIDNGRAVDIAQTPTLALKGADMPAIIIEPIDLANPNDEIDLENVEYIQKISGAIADGIKNFIDKNL